VVVLGNVKACSLQAFTTNQCVSVVTRRRARQHVPGTDVR
jgi:hypothetical protein